MVAEKKKVKGKRVYVTFLHDDTIAIHPSNCKGDRYRMRNDGSIHISKNTTAPELGKRIFEVLKSCTV